MYPSKDDDVFERDGTASQDIAPEQGSSHSGPSDDKFKRLAMEMGLIVTAHGIVEIAKAVLRILISP